MRVKPKNDWILSSIGVSFSLGAVGGGDGGGHGRDVGVIEAAEDVAQDDRQVGGEGCCDAQHVGLGTGAGQLTALQGGDGGLPVDPGADGVAVCGGDGVDEPGDEGRAGQPVSVSDEQVDRGDVGQQPGGVGAQQPGQGLGCARHGAGGLLGAGGL